MKNIGYNIKLDGAGEYNKNISEIRQSMSVLKSEMLAAVSGFDKNDKSIEALTARKQSLDKVIDEQKKAVELLSKIVDETTKAYGENDSRVAKWTVQLNKAKAELNGLERELKSNQSEVSNLGTEMDGAGNKTGIFGDMLKANISAESIKAGATAIIGLIKDIAQTAADAAKELVELGKATADYANQIGKGSQALGLSKQAYQEWGYILEQNNLSHYNMSYGMRNLQTAMADTTGEVVKIVNVKRKSSHPIHFKNQPLWRV